MLCIPGALIFVAVSTPWGDECGEVAIIHMEGNTVVSIPAVEAGRFGVTGYRACLMEGVLGVFGFTCGVKVKHSEVNGASRLAILCTYDHAMSQCDRLSY